MKAKDLILPAVAFGIGAFLAKRNTAAVGMVFKGFDIKLPGMRKEADFTIYPYDGGDYVLLQSDTRILRLNLRTGIALVSKPRSGGAYGVHLNQALGAKFMDFPKDKLVEIQEYLWHNSGRQSNGVIITENKDLFSE